GPRAEASPWKTCSAEGDRTTHHKNNPPPFVRRIHPAPTRYRALARASSMSERLNHGVASLEANERPTIKTMVPLSFAPCRHALQISARFSEGLTEDRPPQYLTSTDKRRDAHVTQR